LIDGIQSATVVSLINSVRPSRLSVNIETDLRMPRHSVYEMW